MIKKPPKQSNVLSLFWGLPFPRTSAFSLWTILEDCVPRLRIFVSHPQEVPCVCLCSASHIGDFLHYTQFPHAREFLHSPRSASFFSGHFPHGRTELQIRTLHFTHTLQDVLTTKAPTYFPLKFFEPWTMHRVAWSPRFSSWVLLPLLCRLTFDLESVAGLECPRFPSHHNETVGLTSPREKVQRSLLTGEILVESPNC